MCGITGVLSREAPPSAALIQRMTDTLSHRGPDDEGYMTDGAVALGHRRLSILDLSAAGHQPMRTEDGRFTISYNGELYNQQLLRNELEARGVRFRSRTDTEVVLYAMSEWGEDALLRFDGMYAFALWDRVEKKLLLARDRYGIKPLYYAWTGKTLVFGSEVKALLVHPGLRAQVDPEALLEYMTFQNFFTDKTLFRDVRLLPAGSVLTCTPARSDAVVRKYWDFMFQEPERQRPESEYVEELNELFQQAVRRQLMSDVPVASYLSGGIDSGSITAVAASQIPYITTFTVGFDLRSASGLELAFDEREEAEHLSYLLRTEHYEMVLKAGDLERAMSDLIWHLEEPRVGQSYPNFYAAKLASRFGKVVLAGIGSDELFGGYPWRYYRAVVNDDFEHYVDKYYRFWQRLVSNTEIKALFGSLWNDVRHVSTRDIMRDVFVQHADQLATPQDYINHSLYFEARTFLHGLLVMEDKLSMAHGLETRVPFLDNDIVDFAQRLPVQCKLGNLGEIIRLNENEPGPKTEKFFGKTRDGKLLLRKVMGRYVTEEVSNRVKQGFTAPDASWFRGESIDYIKDVLLDPNARIREFFDRRTVSSLIGEHLDGQRNRRLLIWSLLSLEHWCKNFLPATPAVSTGR